MINILAGAVQQVVQTSGETAGDVLGLSPVILMYFVACFLAGLLRVWVTHDLQALASKRVVGDLIAGSAGGVVFPYLIPEVAAVTVPPVVIAIALFAFTYSANDFTINVIRKLAKRFGLSSDVPPSAPPPLPPVRTI